MYDRKLLESLQPPRPKSAVSDAVWGRFEDNPTGEIVLVGEAPGREEVDEGLPFIGPAGQLLRGVMAELGLRRSYLTNASLYRPRPHGSQDSRPLPTQLTKERPRLLTELSMLQPKAVVAMGASAALALAPNKYRVRGRVVNVNWLGTEFIVYFTWHPAYVFRNPDVYSDIYDDIQRAVSLQRPISPSPNIIVPRQGERLDFETDTITVDVESTGTPVHLADLTVGTFDTGQCSYIVTPDNAEVFADAISRYRGKTVGHNTPGDEALLRRYGIQVRFTDDTLLHHHAHDSRKGSHGLKTLAPVIAGVDTACDLIAPYVGKGTKLGATDDPTKGWANIPQDKLIAYCAGDAVATSALHNVLSREDDETTRRLYGFLQRGARCFTEGLVKGIRIDRELLRSEYAKASEHVAQLKSGFAFDPDSSSQTLEALQKEGYEIGNTRKETLQKLEGTLPEKILAYRKDTKLYTAFLKPLEEKWLGQDSILHPLHKLYGTGSGRTSSSEPNVQQIPESLRHLFCARPGTILVGWDFKAHEVRGLCYFTEDRALAAMLEQGLDPHTAVANAANVARPAGKRGVFGRAYGAGKAKLLSPGLFPSGEAVDRVMAVVDAMFPRIGQWGLEVVQTMVDRGYLETPYARRRWFPYINKKNRHHLENVARNFPPQSLCNDIALESGFKVFEEFGIPTLLFVHDACYVEVPKADAQTVADFVTNMELFPNKIVRFVPEVHIAETWGGMKVASDSEGDSDSDDNDDPGSDGDG